MGEFRKQIIRSSAITDDIEQEEDYYRLSAAEKHLSDLINEYYGYGTSFLPYTHDRIDTNEGFEYSFDPDAAKLFVDELVSTIDELYWREYPLPDDFFDNFNEDTKEFYRSFLYLAIRIASIKMPPTVPDGHHAPTGNGTFNDLLTLTKAMVIPYSEAGFHRRFEIGIQDRELPQLFYDIQKICRALGKENCFLHTSESAEEQANALKEDSENEIYEMMRLADENGMSYEQLKATNQYLRESSDFIRKQEDEDFKKQLDSFKDADTFINCSITYRDLLFHYNNRDTEVYITNALNLFLLRNGHSVLSDNKTFQESRSAVMNAIKKIKNSEKLNIEEL